MFGYELSEFGAQGRVPPGGQLRLDAVLDHHKAERFEPLHLEPGERLGLQVSERTAAPQGLRFPQQGRGPVRVAVRERLPPGGRPVIEGVQVQLAGRDPQHVTGRPGEQPWLSPGVPVGERFAQARDLDPQYPLRGARGLIAEQFVDQVVARDDPVGVAQQQREQCPLPRTADPDRRRAAFDLEWPEDREHQASVHAVPPSEVSSQAGVLASRTGGNAVETVLKRPRLRLNGLEFRHGKDQDMRTAARRADRGRDAARAGLRGPRARRRSAPVHPDRPRDVRRPAELSQPAGRPADRTGRVARHGRHDHSRCPLPQLQPVHGRLRRPLPGARLLLEGRPAAGPGRAARQQQQRGLRGQQRRHRRRDVHDGRH